MRLALGLALLLACGESTAPDDANPDVQGDKVSSDPVLGMFVGLHDGARVAANLFATKDDVFFATLFTAGGPLAPSSFARDHYFRVLDVDGRIVSTSALECRRVFVDANGSIATLYGGIVNDAACPHNTGHLAAIHGGVTVGLMPFDDAPRDHGGRRYRLELTPVDGLDWKAAMYREFIVGDLGACGDGILDPGEACDDGNVEHMDGCDSFCRIEHLCCCGDGVLDPGEACDDGNHADGDDCTSQCKIP
jgi:cysteine-rich repeat protein